MSKVWIGTSGWTYDGWRGPFYPPDHRDQRLVLSNALAEGCSSVAGPNPEGFAWKASKFITHWKRLSENCANSIELMETREDLLALIGGIPRMPETRRLGLATDERCVVVVHLWS
jgi:uncharacterized protein YecE (DUF72 family)